MNLFNDRSGSMVGVRGRIRDIRTTWRFLPNVRAGNLAEYATLAGGVTAATPLSPTMRERGMSNMRSSIGVELL